MKAIVLSRSCVEDPEKCKNKDKKEKIALLEEQKKRQRRKKMSAFQDCYGKDLVITEQITKKPRKQNDKAV